MTTGKTKALTRQTLVGKVMSLLLNMLSRLVITFLPRSKRLLISWLQSSSAVILDRMWSTGEGNDKPLQYFCLENPMNSMKSQKYMTLKDELSRLAGAQYATEAMKLKDAFSLEEKL